ncbi:hypothetical protein GCM10008094_20070 [Aidingimonas halophila]|nr:hypothetical protein GCM10008094_20070 [Aidingimonas halophila]
MHGRFGEEKQGDSSTTPCFLYSEPDAFSRRLIGWRVSRTPRTDMVLDTLGQALHDRPQRSDTDLIHHSD